MNRNLLLFILLVVSSSCLMCIADYPVVWHARSASFEAETLSSPLRLVDNSEDTGAAGALFRQVFNESYERNLDNLQAFSTKENAAFFSSVDPIRVPYSDYWFPEKYGGTDGPNAENDGKGPATKALQQYDAAFYGGVSTATKWEKENHNNMEVNWYGHCNGFSAAAARHTNPLKAVEKNGVTFTPMQIRALLAEVYMNSIARFVGGHRCEKEVLDKKPQNRDNPLLFDECEDPDPGTFHLALVNWLARKKQPLIADFNADREVWNFPIFSIRYKYEKNGKPTLDDPYLTAAEATEAIGSDRYDSYIYNPQAVKFVIVRMDVVYTNALEQSNPEDATPQDQDIKRVLRYILELDSGNNIIGGEWLGFHSVLDAEKLAEGKDDSRVRHPDFIWVPFQPVPSAGNRTEGNPHIKWEEVYDLWKTSTGYVENDPANPLVLKAPSIKEEWGRVASWYKIKIDGSHYGSSYLGKPIPVEIIREASTEGREFSLEVKLNERVIHTIKTDVSGDIKFDVDPRHGVNHLDLTWMSVGGVELDGPSRSFRFYAM